MNQFPRELVDAILLQCITRNNKNLVLPLRLVCRLFNRILKPYVCRTLDLEFSRLSKLSGVPLPQRDALQTIGYHCKSIYIDLMVMRDEMEVEVLDALLARIPSMADFCRQLRSSYTMNESSFTETDFYQAIEEMLFYCRDVDRLRLALPFQLVGLHWNIVTMILANTLKAFAQRPEEDSAKLNTLVLENVTDTAICHLWMNPTDVMNIMRVMEVLEHLVLTLRRHEREPQRVGMFGSCLWNLVENAGELKSLCLLGIEYENNRPPNDVKVTKSWQSSVENWRARSLPGPQIILSNLTCLELKGFEVSPEFLTRMAESFGSTLQELYLNQVYLKVEQSSDWNQDCTKVLWVGKPNQRPSEDCQWIAMMLRCAMRQLRVCRACFLAYDQHVRDDMPESVEFDFVDPSGLGRSLSQRFVEVVTGIRQPNDITGGVVEYVPADSQYDHLIHNLKPRTRALTVVEYDTKAYQTAVDNSTSEWVQSIDGVFVSSHAQILHELHYIAKMACQGMDEFHRQNRAWAAENIPDPEAIEDQPEPA